LIVNPIYSTIFDFIKIVEERISNSKSPGGAIYINIKGT
jgi:hypothetical protein